MNKREQKTNLDCGRKQNQIEVSEMVYISPTYIKCTTKQNELQRCAGIPIFSCRQQQKPGHGEIFSKSCKIKPK